MRMRTIGTAAAGAALLLALVHVPVREAHAADPKDVRVINTEADPVPVTGLVATREVPSRQPFQRDVSIEVPAGASAHSRSFVVPAGKRLVIEFVSGSTRVHVAELVGLNVLTRVAGETVSHSIEPSVYRRELPPGVQPDFMVTFAQSLRLYADPGSTVTLIAARSENAEILATLNFKSYFVSYLPANERQWIGQHPSCCHDFIDAGLD